MNKINENKLNSKNVIKNSIIIGISSLFLVGVNCEMLAAIFLMLFVPSVLLHKLEYKVNTTE